MLMLMHISATSPFKIPQPNRSTAAAEAQQRSMKLTLHWLHVEAHLQILANKLRTSQLPIQHRLLENSYSERSFFCQDCWLGERM